jgi:hypothetical protein
MLIDYINKRISINPINENINNLVPNIDVGIVEEEDDTASKITIPVSGYGDISISNGIFLNPIGSNLTNSFSNKKIKIFNNIGSGIGGIEFKISDKIIPGKRYAIVYDVFGTCASAPNLYGFSDNLTNLITEYPNNSINNPIQSGTTNNNNRYFIFTATEEIVSLKKSFFIKWNDISSTNIELFISTFQLYEIDSYIGESLDNFEIDFIKELKGTSIVEKNSTLEMNLNGVIICDTFIEENPT